MNGFIVVCLFGGSRIFIWFCWFTAHYHFSLRLFETAKDFLQVISNKYHVIGGLCSPTHDGYGKASLVSASHRATMLQLALADSKWVST